MVYVSIPAPTPITIDYKLYTVPVDFEEYKRTEESQRLRLTEGSNAARILQFLADHPDQGFTPKEISTGTGVPRGSVGTTLSRLEDHDLVRHEEPYWAIGADDRLGAYSAMIHGIETATDRFGDEDWGDWEETAVDPRDVDDV